MSARAPMRLRSPIGLAPRAIADRPGRAVLTGAAIALGVALVLATLGLSSTIDHSLQRVYATAYGNTDLILSSANGGARLPAAAATKAKQVDGVDSANGIVTSPVSLIDRPGHAKDSASDALQLAGLRPGSVDPAGVSYLNGHAVRGGDELTLQADYARSHGLRVGQRVTLAVPSGRLVVRLVGTYAFSAGGATTGQGFGLLAMDTARRAFDAPRGFDIVAIKAGTRDLDGLARRLRAALGPGVTVATSSQQAGQVLENLNALKLLLAVFGGMSLLTAAVLINGILALTMAERRRQIGVLRALGAPRRLIRDVVLVEVVLLALLATAVGLALGVAAEHGLMAIARALGVPSAGIQVPGWAIAVAAAAGLVVPVVSALGPARRAAAMPPVRALAGRGAAVTDGAGRPLAGALLVAAGTALVAIHPGGTGATATVITGGGAAAVLLLGVALLAPRLTGPLVTFAGRRLLRVAPVSARVAGDAVRSDLARTTAAAATLMIGLGLVTALGTLGESFLHAISGDLSRGLRQDLTIQPPRLNPLSGAPVQTIAPSITRRVAATPGVAVATPERLLAVRRIAPGEPGLLLGVDPRRFGAVDGRRYDGASGAEVLAALARGEVAVAGGLAKRAGLHRGGTLRLRGPQGTVRARIAATFPDPAYLDRTVLMSTATLARTYGVRRDSAILVTARDGTPVSRLAARLDDTLAPRAPLLQVLTTSELRGQVNTQVAQQFGILNVLLSVAIQVSLLGLIVTLMMSVLERTREIATLRALGMTVRQVRRTVACEALLIATAGVIVGLVAGVLLGALFLWRLGDLLPSITLVVPVVTIAGVAVLAFWLAALGSALPARHAARMRLLDGLSYD